jgi:3-hydroxyisobutyrate dehydrogenase-like beta-hydroxyacid dehydrogenase
MTKIAWLGTGKMGGGMAARLLGSGHALTVWNRSAGKTAPLAAKGARVAKTPGEAARGADIVFAMVADDGASQQVWLGPDGALAAMEPGALVIECSTLSARHVAALSKDVQARGIAYLDCPVTGLPPVAAEGKLTLLAGGPADVLERARPFLQPLGTTIRHFGPIGTGTAYKLINNMLGAVHIASLAEAAALAIKLGLDTKAVGDALQSAAVSSPAVMRHAHDMMAGTTPASAPFTVGLRGKDIGYARELAAAHGVPMAIIDATHELYRAAAARDFDASEASLVQDVLARAGSQKKSP